ncbi:uncharacterized protein LOC118818221 isoform X2 [Colossoma macropomum]|nr:uncharacterized protein LOC118818221 isoform X2 [Colossoma macropomum]
MMTVSVSPTKDGHPGFWPAEIFGSLTVKAGEDLLLKCSIFDRTKSSNILNMYLFKNGVAVRMELFAQKDEHTFILRNVSVLDSGNYSCVYSWNKFPLKNMSASALKLGQKSIHVQVTVGEHPQKNMSTNEQNDGQAQFSVPLENLLILLLVLFLAVIFFLGMYRITAKIFTKLCHNQEQRYIKHVISRITDAGVELSDE